MKNISPFSTILDGQQVALKPAAKPLDADAARALAWIEHGKPQPVTSHDDDLPSQTENDLKQFKPASYVKEPSKPD